MNITYNINIIQAQNLHEIGIVRELNIGYMVDKMNRTGVIFRKPHKCQKRKEFARVPHFLSLVGAK